jgi:hypothetical protein
VNVHLNEFFKGDETLQKLGYDMEILCTGFKYEAPKRFLKGELAKCIDPVNGQIQVNQFSQVSQQHPLLPANAQAKTFEHIFSFGDVCVTPANENKSIISMM